MPRIYSILTMSILIIVASSCKKTTIKEEVADPGLGQLIELRSDFSGFNATFKYDQKNRLISFNTDNYIYYNKSNLISHLVQAGWRSGWELRSAIFTYNNQNKLIRVNYSKIFYNKPPYDSILVSLAKENLAMDYDSLTYDASNRISEIYRFGSASNFVPRLWETVIFHYDGSITDFPFKIQRFGLEGANREEVSFVEELLIYTNGLPAPWRSLWFFPFFGYIGASTLPILVDNPSTGIEKYLPMIGKCINQYEVKNIDTYYNTKSTYPYNCIFNADSTVLTIVHPMDNWDRADYYFKR